MTGIFLDLDGTLLDGKNNISNEDLSFIKEISKKHNVYITTGKSLKTTIDIYKKLELNTWLVTSQGSVISKPYEDKCERHCITYDQWLEIEKENFDNVVVDMDGHYYQKGDLSYDLSESKKRVNEVNHDILGIYIKTDKEVKTSLDQYLWDLGDGNMIKLFRPYGINKEFALKKIVEWDKLTKVYFVGDGRADINSLKIADVGVAMINSHDKVKEAADYITEFDNNNSGVSRALKKYL